MSFYDSLTTDYSSAAVGLDTQSVENGGGSLFDSALNVVTKGVPLTALAIVNSFANTGIQIANLFGADVQEFDTRRQAQDYFGEDTANYYDANSGLINFAALAIGSFVPGGLAVKALKALQATGETGLIMGRALGYFTANRTKILAEAKTAISMGESALFPSLTADKYRAIALGFGEQVLQSVVWETATAATMHANPILNDMDVQDTLTNIGVGGLFGGVVGGGVDALLTLRSFNKLTNEAFKATNVYENVIRMGGKEAMYGAGDRAAAILESLQATPEATTPLARARATSARSAAVEDAKKHLQALTPGDPYLANSLFDSLYTNVRSGRMSTEDAGDFLWRLSKMSRLTADETANATGSVPTGENFFVNSFAKGTPRDFADLITATPHEGADLSRFYRIKVAGDTPVIAKATDRLQLPDGSTVPRYASAKEAFADGADMFIDGRLKVFVNKSPESRLEQLAPYGEGRILSAREEKIYRQTGKLPDGSKPLTGAPVIFNRFTGAITDSAIPVVGDLSSEIKAIDRGLLVGDRLFEHSLDNPITAETSALDANSRYVWAAKRGIKNSDEIASTDLAMLEQLHREGQAFEAANRNNTKASTFFSFLERKKVSVVDAEGTSVTPGSLQELEDLILAGKQQLGGEALAENPKLSVAELSQLINAPEHYIENSFRTNSFADAVIDPAQHADVNHLKLEYQLNNVTRVAEGMVARGAIDFQYRVKLIKDAALSALSSYAGPRTADFLIDVSSQQIGLEGAGASFFGAANAGYGTAAQKFERTGRSLSSWIQTRNQAIAEKLASPVAALYNDPAAAQEANFFTFIRHTTNEQFVFAPKEIITPANKLTENSVVLLDSLIRDSKGNVTGWNEHYVPKGFQPLASRTAFTLSDQMGVDRNALHTMYELSPKVAAYERANREINNARIDHRNNWWLANGMAPRLQKDILYAPPLDTSKYPYFVMVRQKAGQGWADNSVAVVTAKSANELQEKIAHINADEFDIFTKADIKKHHEVLGDYEYGRNFAQSYVNSELKRKGVLNNLVPDVGVEGLVRNIIDFHAKQETRLARDYVELGNSQLFAEMKAMGARYTGTETSKTGFTSSSFGKTAANPFNDMIKTALAISNKENYRLWSEANDVLENTFSSAFTAARNGFLAAKQNIIPFEEANVMANRMGIGNIYGSAIDAGKNYEAISRMLPPQRYLSKFVGTANSVMAATAIRLDAFQALINVVSTPVLLLAEAHSANQAVQELLSTSLPGTAQRVPSATKLMFQGVASFVRNDSTRAELTPILKRIGALKDNMGDYYNLIDQMTLPYGKLSESQWIQRTQQMVELGSKYTGNNVAEEMSRFVPGYVAYKIFKAAGYAGKELEDNMATFVNRVQGNFVAHQRPIAFQGALGQAIGLFQTYQVNLLQQMFRYVSEGQWKSLALLAGAQATLYGVNGLPGFQAINQHLIGAAPGNPSHADAYSSLVSQGIGSSNPLSRGVGDYLLYGSLSNILSTGLYSRGDISPRNVTILPINPLDFPAVSGGIKFLSAVASVGRNIANGGSIPTSLLLGLEHNGLSRPLAGLAQLTQGYITTGKGGIVVTVPPWLGSNSQGMSEFGAAANFSRLLGARPLDEAVVLDALYRRTMYQASDRTRIEHLGEAFKTQVYGGKTYEPDALNGFLSSYASAGGTVTSFGKSILAWTQQANASTANQIYRQLQTPANQNMIRAMGGIKLPDFSSYSTSTALPPAQTE